MFRNHLGAFALAALCALPLAASAQTAPNPGIGAPPAAQPGAQHRAHRGSPYLRAMRGLHLSDAQRQQIAGIQRADMQAMRRQIEGILTPDQRTQLHAKVAQAHRHFAQPNGQARQAPPQ